MKKYSLLAAMALILPFAASCNKTPSPAPAPVIDYGNFKFTSTFTRRDNKTEWLEKEQIAILWQKTDKSEGKTTAAASAAGTKAEFTAKVDSASIYWAVYPANANVSLLDSAKFSITVPSSQGGFLARTGVSIASTDVKTADFTFTSIIPTLKITVDRDDITGVYIRGYNGEAITGTVSARLEGDKVLFSAATATSDEIELAVDGAGAYYVAVLPGISLPDGLLVRYGKSGEYFPAKVFTGVSVADATKISDLGSAAPVTEYSVANSEDARKLKELIETPSTIGEGGKAVYDSLNIVARGWIANGLTFNLAEGTFDLLEGAGGGEVIDLEYWYYGNRYKSPVTITLKGAGADRTFLTGNVDADKTKGHGLFKVQDYTHFHISGVTLKDTYRPGTNKGGAIQIASKTMCEAHVSNCDFINNNTPGDGGAAIGMVDGGILVAKNCNFSGNTGKNGGVIYATGVSHSTIEDCTFVGNNGTAQNGASVAMLWGDAFMTFNRCLFKDNRASDRAVINHNKTSVVFLNACSFENNSNTQASKYASAINAAGEFTGINNCTFYKNNIKDGSAPQNNSECISCNGNMILANTTFYEYFQANRGVIACLAAGKEAYIFNNVVLNDYSGCAFYFSSGGYTVTSYGHNIYRNVTDYRSGAAKIGIPAATGDIAGADKAVLGNASYDAANHLYKWDGTLTSGTIVPATLADFETCVKAYETVLANVSLSGTKAGDAFWNWLTSIKATDVDQTGVSRGKSWWPGSYQFN
ncbi:MAG: right-handed parallel beta-helix repeat-containing protein [Bacteroidales bacterium]|nr:right-handed parallel beta-helix repeat-containing protein [Bacteroidales bacterium]